MADEYEFKVVKAPMNSPSARERILNREARDGWEVVETTRGPLLSRMDQITLRRPAGYRAERKADVKAQKAERVARFDAWRAARKAPRSERTRGGATPPHEHEWSDQTNTDDRRNGILYFTCWCGQTKTESAPA